MSAATKSTAKERRILAVTLDNESGALMRVVNLFSSRGYNIESLTVSEVDEARKLSRVTIVTHAPERVIKHIINLLERLVPVHDVRDLSADENHVELGLMLVKVAAVGGRRTEILHVAGEFGARLAHSGDDFFILHLTEGPERLNRFVKIMHQYGILEIARTGVTALSGSDTGQPQGGARTE